MWMPKTYADYRKQGGVDLLEWSNVDGSLVKCPNCELPVHARQIIDCRNLDNTYVPEEWACDRCWTVWINNARKPENLLLEIEEQAEAAEPGGGKEKKTKNKDFLRGKGIGMKMSEQRLEEVLDTPLNKGRASQELREVLNEMIEKGFEIKTKRKHCFTASQWLELHGAPNRRIQEFKGKKRDFFT